MAQNAKQVFDVMSKAVGELGPSLVAKTKGVIKFDVTGAGIWLVDLKNGSGKVAASSAADKADLTITISEPNFLQLIDNKLNPQQAFMKGLIKIKGNMALAMKLNVVTTATRDYIKKHGLGGAAAAPAAAAPAPAAGGLKSAAIFQALDEAVKKDGKTLKSKVNGVIQFVITPNGKWNLDLKSANPALTQGEKKADVTLTVSDDDFVAIATGKLNPQQAFMKGLVKIKGNMGLAMKLNVVIAATRNYMKTKGAAAPAAAAPAAAAPAGLKSAEIFKVIGEVVGKDDGTLAKKVGGVIQFVITPGGAWNLDCKSSPPALTQGTKKADVTITVGDDDFVAIASGKLNAQQAFMKGKLKLKGNMGLAMKLPVLFNAIKPKAKL